MKKEIKKLTEVDLYRAFQKIKNTKYPKEWDQKIFDAIDNFPEDQIIKSNKIIQFFNSPIVKKSLISAAAILLILLIPLIISPKSDNSIIHITEYTNNPVVLNNNKQISLKSMSISSGYVITTPNKSTINFKKNDSFLKLTENGSIEILSTDIINTEIFLRIGKILIEENKHKFILHDDQFLIYATGTSYFVEKKSEKYITIAVSEGSVTLIEKNTNKEYIIDAGNMLIIDNNEILINKFSDGIKLHSDINVNYSNPIVILNISVSISKKTQLFINHHYFSDFTDSINLALNQGEYIIDIKIDNYSFGEKVINLRNMEYKSLNFNIKKRWTIEPLSVEIPDSIRGYSIFVNSTIISTNRSLFKLDKNFKLIWRYPSKLEILSAPVITQDYIFIAVEKGIYKINSYTGELLEKINFNESVSFYMNLKLYNNQLIYTVSGGIFIYDINTKNLKGITDYSRYGKNPPLYFNNFYYFSSYFDNSFVKSSDLENTKWKINLNASSLCEAVDFKNSIIVGDHDGYVYKISSSGIIEDTKRLAGNILKIETDNNILKVITSNNVFLIDGNDFKSINTFEQAPDYSQINNTSFITSKHNTLSIINIYNSYQKSEFTLPSSIKFLMQNDKDILIFLQDNNVYKLSEELYEE